MIRLMIAVLLLIVIAANVLMYQKMSFLEMRITQLEMHTTTARSNSLSDAPPNVSDPVQEALLKEAAPLLEKARTAIQNADYSTAQTLLKEARGPLNEMKKSAGIHSTIASDWLHHQIDDLHKQIVK